MMDIMDQFSALGSKGKAKKGRKPQFNDGLVDAGDRSQAKRNPNAQLYIAIAVGYIVALFLFAVYTRNYLVMMIIPAILFA